jgi:hypothetical protein
VARAGDQLVVTRLGRSLEHLIDTSHGLQDRSVDLVVLDQGIDTSTAVGRMFFQILGAIAKFEHALMSERTMDGLAAARARGRTGGQKPKLTPGPGPTTGSPAGRGSAGNRAPASRRSSLPPGKATARLGTGGADSVECTGLAGRLPPRPPRCEGRATAGPQAGRAVPGQAQADAGRGRAQLLWRSTGA